MHKQTIRLTLLSLILLATTGYCEEQVTYQSLLGVQYKIVAKVTEDGTQIKELSIIPLDTLEKRIEELEQRIEKLEDNINNTKGLIMDLLAILAHTEDNENVKRYWLNHTDKSLKK